MPDGNEALFRVTDLKQYLYCKRILYFHGCLPDVRPTTYKMQVGINAHETEQKRSARRSLKLLEAENGIRHFDVPLISHQLGLSGEVDEVIEIGGTTPSLIPVDYKVAKQSGFHFEVQLAAYALMLEESGIKVKTGYIYLIPVRKTISVPITSALRNTVKRAILEMHDIVLREQMPAPTDYTKKCASCEFKRFCNDVL